jgi:hypothetical protein
MHGRRALELWGMPSLDVLGFGVRDLQHFEITEQGSKVNGLIDGFAASVCQSSTFRMSI